MRHKRQSLFLALSLLLTSIACHHQKLSMLQLEACDPVGYMPCVQQSAHLAVPIADTNLLLTYSSPADANGREWDAMPLGLGGWSLNVVQRYDRANRVLIGGDGSWRLVEGIPLPAGNFAVPSYDGALAYIFDSAGRHIRTVDGHLGTELIRITYDPSGHLASVDGYADGLPLHLVVRRDPQGNPRVLIGIDGASTALEVDDKQHLTAILDPASAETKIAWNAKALVESKTDPAGGIQRFTYDSSGQLASATDADDITQRYERKTSSDSLEIRTSTPTGRQWTYRVEAVGGGVRRTLIKPDRTQTIQTTDAKGSVTLKLADGTSWAISTVPGPVWGSSSPILTPMVETRPDGVSSRREIKYNLHAQNGLPYVLAGAVTATVNGASWTQNFNPAQRTTELVDPTGHRTLSHYDEHGRLLNYSAPGTAPTSYAYDSRGRLETETVASGTSAHTFRYSYDVTDGRIITNRPDGVVETASVDRAGRIISLSAGDGSTALFDYDVTGRLIQVQPPGGLRFALGASPAGRTTAFVPPMVSGDASVEISSYDRDGLLTTTSGLGRRAISYDYNSAGKVISSTFDQGKRTSAYDPASGLRTQASDPSGVNTRYEYVGSTPTSLTWSGAVAGSVSTKLDANGRAVLQSVDGGHDVVLGYDAAGNLTGVGPLSMTRDPTAGLVTQSSLGAVESKQQFDANDLLIRTTTTAGGKLILDQRYTRDALGRIKAVSETSSDGKTTTTEYSYDRADRLASVRVNGRIVESDNYDPAGNRLSAAKSSASTKAGYDDRDRLLRAGSTQYSWMSDGSLAGVSQDKGATAFVYDDFGALRQASLPDGRKINYLVDANGRRVGRVVAGKLVSGYLYNLDGSIAAETDGTGKITSRFAYDDLRHLATLERDGIIYRVVTDPVGSPRVVINSKTGEVVEEISYDAWGNITADKSPGFLCIGFAGGLRDPDTGLIRFGARDYDPETGRWTATDPIRFRGGNTNLYLYAAADPVNLTDPTGQFIPGLYWTIPIATGTAYWGGLGWRVNQWLNQTPTDTTPNSGSPSNGNSGSNDNSQGWCASPLCFNVPPTQLVPLNGSPNNSPPNDYPTLNPSPAWSCKSPGTCNNGAGLVCSNGTCFGVNGQYFCSADYCTFPDGSGCVEGYCGFDPDGNFFCKAAVCTGPDGQSCGVVDSGTCQLGPPDTSLHGTHPSQPNPNSPGQPNSNNPGQPNPNNPNNPNPNNPNNPSPNNPNNPIPNNPNPNGPGKPNPNGPGQPNNPPPPGPGPGPGSNGDPHLDTIRGLRFDFQAVGEFLIARSLDGKQVIEARQEPYFAGAPVTVNTGVAANVDGDRIGVYVKEPAFLVVNGVPLADPDVERRLPHGGKLARHGGTVLITWPDTSRLSIVRVADSLNYDFDRAAGTNTQFSGLLSGTNSASDQIAARDGDTLSISDPDFVNKLYKQVGNSWRVKQSESLFRYWPGESTAKFTDLNFPPKYVSVDTISSAEHSKAESICRAVGVRTGPLLDDCILDVVVTGKPAFAVASIGVRLRSGLASAGTASYATTPVVPASADHFAIKIGDTVSPDHPAKGAGIIQALGQKQYYSFSGMAGQSIFVGLGPCEGAQPNFDLLNPDSKLLANVIGNCHASIGRQTLPASGTYTIVTSTDKANINSRYNFFVHPVLADEHFPVRLPLTVAPGAPDAKAGHISAEGAQQFFDFSAPAGVTVHIEGKCAAPCPNLAIRATGVADDSARFFDLNYLKNGWKLPAGGKYTIQVRSNGYVGPYSFTASVAPQP